MDKHQPQDEELRRFCAEAAALLGVKEPVPELLPMPREDRRVVSGQTRHSG